MRDEADRSYTDNAEFWIRIIHDDLDRYRTELTNQAVLDAVGAHDGQRVLDAGCGEGYLSRLLAQRGARVTGVDIAAELIAAARDMAQASQLDLVYHVRGVDELPSADATFDAVVCNHLVSSLPDIARPFAEFHRVLRTGGRLVILTLHPVFYTGNAERRGRDRYPSAAEYFSVRHIDQEFQVAGITSPAKARTWLRPLEDYTSQLVAAGFVITSLEEPHPSVEQLRDPWWQRNFPRPLFLLIVAEAR